MEKNKDSKKSPLLKHPWMVPSLVLILILLITAPLTYLFWRAVPNTEGTLSLPGLSAPVTIIRDNYGIPHIKAKNEEDAFRALGYTIASDRMFHIEVMRRIATGTLCEIFGKKTLKLDYLMRNLRLKKTMDEYMERHGKSLDPQLLKLSESFLGGINYAFETLPRPIELVILGVKPKPLTLTESMAVSGYMALSFAEGLVGDILFHELKQVLPAERLRELRIGTGDDSLFLKKTTSIPQAKKEDALKRISQLPSSERGFDNHKWTVQALGELEQSFGLFHGSNSWVMSGKRTESGKPILANDPHISFMHPSILYEASIHTPTLEIYGHFLPMVPFPILGHDQDKAWAVTMSETDDLDIYQEKFNPLDSNSIFYDNKWIGLQKEEEIIKVRGGEDLPITIKISPHGPMLLPDDPRLETEGLGSRAALPTKSYYALKWGYYHPDNHVSTTFYKLMRAKTLEDYKQALALTASPGLNISWVDKDGNIAWWMMGKIPKLPPQIESDSVLDGSSGKHEYLGYLSFEENPHQVNPPSGLIISANYRPTDPQYAYLDGYWQPSERYERIAELLAKKEKWNIKDLQQVQTDTHQGYIPEFLPTMLKALQTETPERKFKNNWEKLNNLTFSPIQVSTIKDLTPRALEWINKWDGQSNTTSQGASLYHVWMAYISREVMSDELGSDNYTRLARIADQRHFYKWIMRHPDSSWWDDVNTKGHQETQAEIIKRAFSYAILELFNKLGDNPDYWHWGILHAIRTEHFMGKIPLLGFLLNPTPIAAPGGIQEVNHLAYPRHLLTFNPIIGPATRRLIDFQDPWSSLGINPIGQSGHRLSHNYQDQAPLYARGEYRPQWLSWEKIEQLNDKRTLLLQN